MLETDVNKIFEKNKKNLCIINSKKYSNNRYSLYGEREKAIKFFTNSELDFDLFGYGWDKTQFKGILRPLNKISYLRDIYISHMSLIKQS